MATFQKNWPAIIFFLNCIMFIANFVTIFVVISNLTISSGLEQLSNDIYSPDTLRDAVSRLFSLLKLRTNENTKLKEYLTVHQYFASVTSRENQNRKEVTKLIRLREENGTANYTTEINEAVNERNTHEEDNITTSDDEVNTYIDNFLITLAELKENFLVNNSYESINSKVLQHVNVNQSNNIDSEVDSNENTTDESEFWLQTKTRRVYGGKTTKIKYFPFVASVHIFNQFTCAGSIIKSDLVITAASCLQLVHNNRFYRENPAFLSVRVGSTFYNGGGENIPVMEVYFYPSYTPKTLRDNVAIMRLFRALKFKNKRVKKIAIDDHAWALPLNTDGITIVGWGAKTTSNKVHDPWRNRISFDELDIYPLDDCQDVYSKTYVTNKHFCAGFVSRGGGACNRDVGAPGLVRGILTGIVSFGSPSCGAADAPTVFTKLGYYGKWIDEVMSQDVPSYFVRTTTRLPYTQTILATTNKHARDFKIEPISKKNLKRYHEIDEFDALRSEQQQVFKEFLETVFNSKEVQEYESKLSGFLEKKEQELDEDKIKEGNVKGSQDLTRAGNNTEEILNEQSEPEKGVTTMDNAEADNVDTDEPDADASISTPSEEEMSQDIIATKGYHDTKKTASATTRKGQIKQNQIKKEKNQGLSIEDILRKGDDVDTNSDSSSVENSFKSDPIDNDEDLDRQVDQLLKNLDVDKANSSEPVNISDDNSAINDTKSNELLEKNGNEKKDDSDETILTLLFLSEAERKAADLEINEDGKSDESQGMSIDIGNDKLLRTSNLTNERNFMSKDEMYDILMEAIQS